MRRGAAAVEGSKDEFCTGGSEDEFAEGVGGIGVLDVASGSPGGEGESGERAVGECTSQVAAGCAGGDADVHVHPQLCHAADAGRADALSASNPGNVKGYIPIDEMATGLQQIHNSELFDKAHQYVTIHNGPYSLYDLSGRRIAGSGFRIFEERTIYRVWTKGFGEVRAPLKE